LQRPHNVTGAPPWYTVVRRRTADSKTGKVLYDHKRDYLQHHGWDQTLSDPTDLHGSFWHDPTQTADGWISTGPTDDATTPARKSALRTTRGGEKNTARDAPREGAQSAPDAPSAQQRVPQPAVFQFGSGQPDHWIRQSDGTGNRDTVWIRVHHTPRVSLYAPEHATFGGPDPQMLRLLRETRILMTDVTYDIIRDDWHQRTSPDPMTPWVGQTVFFDKGLKRTRLPEQYDLASEEPGLPTWSQEQDEYLQSAEGSTTPRASSSATGTTAPVSGSPTSDFTSATRREVERLHRQFGHPPNESLARMLCTAKADQEVVRYARQYRCPVCESRKRPQAASRATMPYRPTRFNHTVGVDLKFVHDYEQKQYVFLNVLDYATTFNVGILVPAKSAQ